MNRWLYIPLLLLLGLTMPDAGKAHSVNVFAYVEDGQIIGEGSLAGGNPVKNGVVTILLKDGGQTLYTAQTDENGQFAVPIEQLAQREPADLVVRLDAGPGHRSHWQLKAEEFRAAAAERLDSGKSDEGSAHPSPMVAFPPLKNIITGLICILGLGFLIAWSRKKGGKR